jgi:hypothetical protein
MPTPRQRVLRTNDRSFAEDGIDVFIFLVSEKRPACFANHPGMWVSIAPRLQASTDDKRHPLRLLGANVRMICSSRCHRAAFPPRTRQGIGTSSTDGIELGVAAPSSKRWWSQTGSNRRPPACKAGALPTELWPRVPNAGPRERWWAWEDLNFRPHAYQARALTS